MSTHHQRRRRDVLTQAWLAIAAGALVALAAPSPAAAAIGDLEQRPGAQGCVTAGGAAVAVCASGRALSGANDVAVSPDGEHAYVAASGEFPSDPGGVAVFDRDPASGALTQLAGAAGCITHDGSGGTCQDATAVTYPSFVSVSPDGGNVYVVAGGSQESSVATSTVTRDRRPDAEGRPGRVRLGFRHGRCVRRCALDARAAARGDPGRRHERLRRLVQRRPCRLLPRSADRRARAEAGSRGLCHRGRLGRGVHEGRVVTHVIAVTTSRTARTSTPFVLQRHRDLDRDTASGELTQKPSSAGCITDSGSGGACADGRAMQFGQALTVSADGANAYLSAAGALVVSTRDPASGALAQKAGADGCIANDAQHGCSVWHGVRSAADAVVSSDGQSVYSAAFDGLMASAGIGIFDRDPATGALSQRSGGAGCVTHDGSGGACATGVGLMNIRRVAISADGTGVYGVAEARPSNRGSVTVFDREGGVRPDTTITSGPADGETTVGSPTFEFGSSAAGSTFACAVDGGPPGACASPYTLAALAPGAHAFAVRAIDPSGNADLTPATRGFVVAPVPPPPPEPPPPVGGAVAPRNVEAPKVAGSALVGATLSCASPAGGRARSRSRTRSSGCATGGGRAPARPSRRHPRRRPATEVPGDGFQPRGQRRRDECGRQAADGRRADPRLGRIRPDGVSPLSEQCRGLFALTLLKGRACWREGPRA